MFYWAAKGTCKLRSPAAKGPCQWAACPDSDGGPGRDSDTPHLGPGASDGPEVQVEASAPSMRRCHSAHAPSRRAGALGSRARGRHSGWAPPCRGGHHTTSTRGGRHGNLKRKERTCGGSQCRPQAGSELVRAAAVTVPTGTDRPGRARAGALPPVCPHCGPGNPRRGWTSRRATSEAGRSGQVRFITRPKLA